MQIEKGIKSIRKYKGFTQKELAQKLGVTSVTIQNYENDRRSPSIEALKSIANALDVELNIILNGFSKEILTNSDVLYAWKKLNVNLTINEYLKENNQSSGLFLITNTPDTLDEFYLISEKLKLSENEFSNWIKSVAIRNFIEVDSQLKSFLSDENIKAIIKSNTLLNQSYSSLIDNGLSKENKKIVSNFILDKNFFKNITKYSNHENHTTTCVVPKYNDDLSYNEAILGIQKYIDYLSNEEDYDIDSEDYNEIIKSSEELIRGKILIAKKNKEKK